MRRAGSLRRSFTALVRAPSGLTSMIILGLLAVIAIAGPPLFGDEATRLDVVNARQGISAAHPLGTDDLGRDIMARTIVATRLSLQLAIAATALGALLGFPAGAVISVLKQRPQRLANRLLHIALAFPPIIVALFLTAIIGTGASSSVFALGIAIAPGFARIAQTLAAQVAGSDYVAAAQVVGVGRRRLLTRYILPNISEPLIIQGTVTINTALVAIAALSFLGLGVQPPQFDWGRMLAEGLEKIFTIPIVALAPAGAIVIAGLAFSFLGEAMARSLNPVLWAHDAAADGDRTPPEDETAPGEQPGDAGRQARIDADVAAEALAAQPDDDTAVRAAPRDGGGVAGAGRQPWPPPVGAQRPDGDAVLTVEGLTVEFTRHGRPVRPVDGLDFSVRRGEIVGIVGESGSGKTMTALALAQLVPHPGRVTGQRLEFEGRDLLRERPRDLRALLGTKMAMVFQDPMTCLNPAMRVGGQLTEALEVHRNLSHKTALGVAKQRLTDVDISAPERRLRQYPHEFSGGMRQRAMIAMGLMGEPSLLIADEPTTALDVTVQAQIIDLLRELNTEHGTSVILISHDISVISEICDRVLVMYAGHIVEDVDTDRLLRDPAHPYTKALLASVPDLGTDVTAPLATIPGRPPGLDAIPAGCPFAPRCPEVEQGCRFHRPVLERVGAGRRAACWVALEQRTEHGRVPSAPGEAGASSEGTT